MICTKKDHAGGENCVTCTEHQMFKQMGERRRERGIALRQFKIHVEANAAASMNSFFSGWVEELGKERATDLLLMAMRDANDRLRAALQQETKALKRNVGKAQFTRVSAPRLED